jgi:hypothetical protein
MQGGKEESFRRVVEVAGRLNFMWLFRRKANPQCESICDALEASAARDWRGETAASGTLLAQLPRDMRQHAVSCEACRVFAEELAETRAILGLAGSKAEPGPFFLARVMASIASRESELENKAQTWAAVPRLASRLTVLASLGLLIAATWLYQMPSATNIAGWNSSQWAGLVDTGNAQDDLLVSPAGK